MKNLLSFVIALMTIVMISCTPSAVGTWIESTEKSNVGFYLASEEQGFILNSDGSASSINMDFVEFKTWEKKGDLLIINGENTGSTKKSFCDTMKIENLTKTELVLSQGGYSVKYKRK